MKKRQIKKGSKRRSLADEYRVNKKVREHHRKVRKEARKAQKLGLPVKSSSKLTRIPNLFPGKKEIIEEHDLLKEIEKNKQKHSLITPDDIHAMVVEGKANVVDNNEENKVKVTKYDSKRELNSLLNASDIIIEVLDARNPILYRSKELEAKVVKNKDKKLVIVINRVDLVSKENAETWGKFFRRDYPTILFSSKKENDVEEIINLIKQLTLPKKVLHVGVVGYPNTGKTSLIKLFNQKYRSIIKSNLITTNNEIIIDNNLRLFSQPAHILAKNELGPLMPKTTKDVEDLKSPIDIAKSIVDAIPHDNLLELYEIPDFECHISFLENIAKNKNFKIKGGYLDHERAARYIIQDVIDGKIKFETPFE